MSDGMQRDPWWASGTDPDDGLHDEDPLDRHAAGRRGAGDRDGANHGGRPGNGHGGHHRGGGRGGAWWQDAVDALADATRGAGGSAAGSAARDDRGEAVPPGEHGPDGHVCHVCPVCVALRALDDSRPEVVAHLSEALRHVSLAARAFVEAQVAASGGDDRLRRVDLDE